VFLAGTAIQRETLSAQEQWAFVCQ
jgi:hypothetical protein